MTDSPTFFEVFPFSLNRQGEELCGDQVKILRTADRTIVVLSDGLGSGVKANILARLTTEIIVTMIRANAPLEEVMETVVGTLPSCKVRKIAYATFIIIEIQHRTGDFKMISFDSPPVFLLKQGRLATLKTLTDSVNGKQLTIAEGQLERGDFLAAASDGVLYAGMGAASNFGWGWKEIGGHLERLWATEAHIAERLVRGVMRKTESLYAGNVGDDATMVGILARHANRLMIFTGPPKDRSRDERCVERLMQFEGRRIVCGGTTSNIVAEYLGQIIETDLGTLREDVPPVGYLPELDLMTEGILTLARTLQLLRECHGNPNLLPVDRNGAVLLARELLRADSIFILAGEKVNAIYQNPLLPQSVSIRRSVLDQIVKILEDCHKAVRIEWV